jgi:hypothetical protein
MPKTVLASKFQEWKGLDRISLIVHEMKCIFREITKDDFGIDGEIEIVVPKLDGKGYEATGGIIKVQAKSGMSYVKGDSESSFYSPVKKEDLELWYKANFPTIYIVYHTEDDKLYWKEIQSYVKNTANVWAAPFKVVFDKKYDEFTPNCFENIRTFAPTTDHSRLSFTQQERLFSNLLKVTKLPKVWSAPTQKKREEDIRRSIRGFVPPFLISGGTLCTLSDLYEDNCVLRGFCDVSSIKKEYIHDWWEDDDKRRNYIYLLNQLLGIHLRHCKIRYNRAFGRNYFPRENEVDLEFKTEWYNIRTKRRPDRLTAKFYKYGFSTFWRHTASDLSFKMIGDEWFLQVIPKYFFTVDGVMPWNSEKVGSYTTQIKADENNYHFLNHVLFWADILSRANPHSAKKDEIVFSLDLHTVLVIQKLPVSGIAKFAIPFDPATFEDDVEQPVQVDMFSLLNPIEDNDDHQD